MYSVIPSNTSLYQSFSIPDREMLMYSNYYLAVGTYGSNNTICLRQSGYTYSSEIHNKSVYDQIDAQWQGSTTGVALSYTTFSNGKYRDHWSMFHKFVFFVYIVAETAVYDEPQPDIG